MFSMFPFILGNNSNNRNELDIFNNLFNDDFINNMVDQIMSSDLISNLTEDMMQDDYDITFKDCGDYYLIKGYLPGLSAKDISIDFEKNKAILAIKKKQVYSNNRNSIMTVVQTGGNLIKNFYIEEVDVTKLRASFNNNLLIITMPKTKKAIEDLEKGQSICEAEIIDVDNYKVE